jgi:hypothetical protein
MEGVRERIKCRNSDEQLRGIDSEVIEKSRTTSSPAKRILDSFINHSMWLYYLIILIDLILWTAFKSGTIA